jgi:predicted PurR-regulated permease PerM
LAKFTGLAIAFVSSFTPSLGKAGGVASLSSIAGVSALLFIACVSALLFVAGVTALLSNPAATALTSKVPRGLSSILLWLVGGAILTGGVAALSGTEFIELLPIGIAPTLGGGVYNQNQLSGEDMKKRC